MQLRNAIRVILNTYWAPLGEKLERVSFLQGEVLRRDTIEMRMHLWNQIKRRRNSGNSWLHFLTEACSVSNVVVNPKESDDMYLEAQNGESVPLYLKLDPGVGLKALITRKYDPQAVEFLVAYSDSLDYRHITIVDIGANLGLFSRQCVARFGKKIDALYAYEPDKEIYSLMCMNLADVNSVKTQNSGIAETRGTYEFFVDHSQPSSSSLKRASLPDKFYNVEKVEVEMLSAREESEEWLKTSSSASRTILFYKSDTQGYDLRIAGSLGVSFFEKVSVAIIEVFPFSQENPMELESFYPILESFPQKAVLEDPSNKLSDQQAAGLIESGAGFDLLLWR